MLVFNNTADKISNELSVKRRWMKMTWYCDKHLNECCHRRSRRCFCALQLFEFLSNHSSNVGSLTWMKQNPICMKVIVQFISVAHVSVRGLSLILNWNLLGASAEWNVIISIHWVTLKLNFAYLFVRVGGSIFSTAMLSLSRPFTALYIIICHSLLLFKYLF